MILAASDWLVVVAYVVAVGLIAIHAGRLVRARRAVGDLHPIEVHYLAGRTIGFGQACMSIVATEFSALAFLTIPALVYLENFSYLRFVVGACLSRIALAHFLVPRIYGRGVTLTESVTRGLGRHAGLDTRGRGRRFLTLFYITTKIVAVSARLLAGTALLSSILRLPPSATVTVIAVMTALVVARGGLKAVVLTDVLQGLVFIVGGFVAHAVVGSMSGETWWDLTTYAYANGKFSPFAEGGVAAFALGAVAGIAYDATTHGVDQDFVQKALGAPNLATAQRAMVWSSLGTLAVNLLFLSLGAVIWAYHTKQGLPVPAADEIFSALIQHFPSPVKGLMVAAILAACMSTLDSSINALSACLVNDVLKIDRPGMFRLVVHLDNLIVTATIIIVAHFLTYDARLARWGGYFAYFATTPLLAFAACRLLMPKAISRIYSPSMVLGTVGVCIWGMLLNRVVFGLPAQLSILSGVATTIVFLGLFARIVTWIGDREENRS